MLSLSMPISGMIQACMREWHQKYAAAAAIFLQIVDHFPIQNSPDTQSDRLGGNRPRRCQQRHGRVHGDRDMPLQYAIHMSLDPNISQNWACRVNSLEIMSLAVRWGGSLDLSLPCQLNDDYLNTTFSTMSFDQKVDSPSTNWTSEVSTFHKLNKQSI